MAVIVGQTREELRKSIGHNLGAIRVGTMTGSGSTSTGVDAEMPNADDHENGNHLVLRLGQTTGRFGFRPHTSVLPVRSLLAEMS